MITSTRNPKIKWIHSLQTRSRIRYEEQAFVVEGVRLAEEAQRSGWEARLILYTNDLSERGLAVVEKFAARGAQVEEVTPQVLKAACDTETPQGVLLVVSMKPVLLPDRLDFAFIPDGVRDPGNLGTMLRTATAARVGAVFLPPGTVDPYSPKVVRAGMGAHFRLPIYNLTWEEIRMHIHGSGLHVYVAEVGVGEIFTQANFRAPLALIVGGEAEGASRAAREIADHYVHIPMQGWVESLNAAIAAAILMFEVIRQRNTSIL